MPVNTVSLVGRLVADPIVKEVGNDNITLCQFTIAVDKRGKDAGTNFIDCTAWKGVGNTIGQYFKKGSQIGISGRLNQESWEKDGEKKTKLVVIVDDFTFLSSVKEKTPSEEFGLFDKPKKEATDDIDLSSIPF